MKKLFSVLVLIYLVSSTAFAIDTYKAKEIEPYKPHDIKPYRAHEAGADNKVELNPQKTQETNTTSLDYAFHSFRLRLPGGTYVTPSSQPGYDILHVSPGAITDSVIQINPNGQYVWNSKWDKKIIRGNWKQEKTGTITIINGQGNKNWRFQKTNKRTNNDGDIFVDDGYISYVGDVIP
ncbi:MAG: hypothetical protein HQK91_13315 [Nitrospirae bacterium]|nr:hypothetical protein [Nitrospirota bacterium]